MRCPACGGPDGAHYTLHQRFPQGGGGVNYPCPLGPHRQPYQAVTKVTKAVARDSYDRGLPIAMAGEPDWFDQDRDAHTFTKSEMDGVSFEALHVKSSARYSYAVPVKGKDPS